MGIRQTCDCFFSMTVLFAEGAIAYWELGRCAITNAPSSVVYDPIQHYAGNPLALNMVASGIRDAFGSSISEFVKSLKAGSWPFADISQLLERQFNRLTSSEIDVMYWLAINHEPISFSDLKKDIICPALKQQLPDTLKSLRRKSLIEKRVADRLKPAATQTFVRLRGLNPACEDRL